MSAYAALIPTDLSRIDLLRNGSPGEHWIAPPAGEAPDADTLRRRVNESSLWCARQCGNRRLNAILDVDEAACRWVHAPSQAAAVVAAALKNQGEEWNAVAPIGGVEPITGGTGAPGEALVAITMPDALARLWLDGLDRLGTRVANVATLWHAAASAWNNAPSGTLQAIVLADHTKRLVWAWCDGGRLVTAGHVRLTAAPAKSNEPPPGARDHAPSAAARITLDWAAWSTQLGRTPASVRLIGAGAIPGLEAALRERLAGAAIDALNERDAIAATLRKAGETSGTTALLPEPSRCLTRLTQRPGRRLRWTYRLWGAAMLVLGAGLAVGGVRAWTLASVWNAKAIAARQELTTRVQTRFGDEYLPQPGQNPVTWLRNTLAATNAEGDSMATPPEPRPIFEATSILLEQLATAEGQPKLVKLRLSQADGDNYLQVRGIERDKAYTLREQLKKSGIPLTWELVTAGVQANQQARLNGQWEGQ